MEEDTWISPHMSVLLNNFIISNHLSCPCDSPFVILEKETQMVQSEKMGHSHLPKECYTRLLFYFVQEAKESNRGVAHGGYGVNGKISRIDFVSIKHKKIN